MARARWAPVVRDRSGQASVEYVAVLVLAAMLVGAVGLLHPSLVASPVQAAFCRIGDVVDAGSCTPGDPTGPDAPEASEPPEDAGPGEGDGSGDQPGDGADADPDDGNADDSDDESGGGSDDGDVDDPDGDDPDGDDPDEDDPDGDDSDADDDPDEENGAPDPRPSGLTELLEDLAGEELSTEDYQQAAADHVRDLLDPDDPENIHDRNAAITQAYAELYFLDPELYKWAGMAALASDLVGDGISQAERARVAGIPLVPGVADFSFTELSLSLQYGNALVFTDLAWQHLAYEHGGLAAIEQAYDDGTIPATVLDAWRDIDGGARNGDLDRVWDGNAGLLLHEQQVTLQQGVYDQSRRMYRQLSGEAVGLVAPLTSPIPGDDVTFQDFHSHGDIGDFDDRWAWIEDSMLPAWRDGEPSLTDDLVELAR